MKLISLTAISSLIALLLVSLVLTGCGSSGQEGGRTADTIRQEIQALDSEIAKIQQQKDALLAELKKLDPTSSAEKKTDVLITEVATKDFKSYVEVQGQVESDQNVVVSPRFSGTYTTILVKEGALVNQGQKLAEIDAAVLRQQLDELRTRLELAEIGYEKQNRLWQQKIGTEMQYLTAKNNRDALKKNIATVEEQLKLAVIEAPITGIIDKVFAKIGELAMPGMPAFRMVGNSSYKVVADVGESYSTKLRKGQIISISFPDLQRDVQAAITSVSNTIDPVNRTFQIEARINSVPDIKPNMVSFVKFSDFVANGIIAVPLEVIQTNEEGKIVYVASDESGTMRARKVRVEVGKIYGGEAVILSGLKAGDKLITTGFNDLVDGEAIQLSNTTAGN